MSPQPLARVKPEASLHIGALSPAGDFDPELCRLAVHVISLWSYTEAGLLRMAAQFLASEQPLVTHMLQAVKNAEGRRAAVKAAGLQRLSGGSDDASFFLAALDALGHAEELRNRYAHQIWASSPDIPDAIILIDPRLIERAEALEAAGAIEGHWLLPSASHFDRMKVMVYRKPDLQKDVSEACDAAIIVDQLVEWYGFRSIAAPELAAPIRDLLLEQYPRLRDAYSRRRSQAQEDADGAAV